MTESAENGSHRKKRVYLSHKFGIISKNLREKDKGIESANTYPEVSINTIEETLLGYATYSSAKLNVHDDYRPLDTPAPPS